MSEGLILRLVYYRYEWYNNLNPKGEIVSMSTVSKGLSLTLEAAYQDDVGVKSLFAPDSDTQHAHFVCKVLCGSQSHK